MRDHCGAPIEKVEVGAYTIPTGASASDGVLSPRDGALRPGFGLQFKAQDAAKFAV